MSASSSPDSIRPDARGSPSPSLEEIAAEWDQNTEQRALELEQELDTSFYGILRPNIKKLIDRYSVGRQIVDVGCGLGYMTSYLAEYGYEARGIDISARSVVYASGRFPQIHFEHLSIESLAEMCEPKFDVCVANMVLHNLPRLQENLLFIRALLRDRGTLIASIPHPCFWYRMHDRFVDRSELHYMVEHYHKVYFKIKNGHVHPAPVTYFHRPIGRYLTTVVRTGFEILEIVEAGAPEQQYPDVLFFACRLSSKEPVPLSTDDTNSVHAK